MASHLKNLAAVIVAALCLGISVPASAEDAGSERTPDATQQGTTADKGPQKYGVTDQPKAETAPVPATPAAPAPKPVVIPVVAAVPANARLVILDGNPVYVDEKFNVIGQPTPAKDAPAAAGAAAADPAKDAKRKETEALAKKIELENNIGGAIRRLSTSGYREAKAELVGYGKDAIPFIIDAMATGDEPGPAAYQLGGHTKAETGRAVRNRPRAEICSELLTEIVTTHTSYKGDLPTLDQQDWQTWWVANGEKISIGK